VTREIQIPFRDRSDRLDLGEISDDVREAIADPEQARLTRRLMWDLATEPGISTTGDLLDRLEAAGPEGRRAMVDRAREAEGVRSAATEHRVDAEPVHEPQRDPQGRIPAVCTDPSCRNVELDPISGQIAMTHARRWWCEVHRAGHEADLEPWTGARLAYGPSGAIIDLHAREIDAERDAAETESRKREREARQAEREDEADRLAVFEAEWRKQRLRELPPGVPG
jgi:hypothetical protein